MANQHNSIPADYESVLARWWSDTDLGRYTAAAERVFLHTQAGCAEGVAVAAALADWDGWGSSAVVKTGRGKGVDVVCALPALPFADRSVHTLLLPHGLEVCRRHEELLKECFRVLQPRGRLVLTGFNPYSLWRFSPLWRQLSLPLCALPLGAAKRLLEEGGFDLAEGRFMVYVPPFKRAGILEKCRFMEHAGNRWWPHAASVYGLVCIKNLVPLNPARQENALPLADGNLNICTQQARFACFREQLNV